MPHHLTTKSLLLLALSLSLGCPQNSTKKPGCDEACTVANMSFNELRDRFGSNEIPKQFAFATPYVEGVSYDDFKKCINEAVQKKTTADALGCSARAHKVCVSECTKDGH